MPPPGMAAEGRAAAAPMLQVSLTEAGMVLCCMPLPTFALLGRCQIDLRLAHTPMPALRRPATAQAFLDSGKMRAPFRPPLAPPGAALSVADQCRVRDRGTIMARQLFAEQGAAFAGGWLLLGGASLRGMGLRAFAGIPPAPACSMLVAGR